MGKAGIETAAHTRRTDRVGLGILLILGATALVAVQEAIIKGAAETLTVWQIFFLRSLILIPALTVTAVIQGRGRATWRHAFSLWVSVRSGLFFSMYLSVYIAVPFVPIATIAAGIYTAPLFVAALSPLLTGEAVRWHRWLAITTGFAGVLLILRPGTDAFDWLTLTPVLGGLFYALSGLTIRAKGRDAPPAAFALSMAILLLVSGLAASIVLTIWAPALGGSGIPTFIGGPWAPMGWAEWGIIAALAAVMFAHGLALPAAYQNAPTTVIATVDYSYLIFVAVLGIVFFEEIPDLHAIAGMILITAAGIVVARSG